MASGAWTAYDVAKQLPWTSRKRALADLDVWNQMLATHETVAHLVVLTDDGRVQRSEDAGVIHYAAQASQHRAEISGW